MTESDLFDIKIAPPNLVVEMDVVGSTLQLEYDLVDLINFEGADAEDIEIIDSHWHGIVLEGPENETHHIDLRDVDELNDD